MGYIKVKHQNLLRYMDNFSEFPKKWDDFVNKQTVYQNLIIKGNGKCTCTNCNHTFNSKKHINETVKCPNCKNTYLIKRSNLKRYTFTDYLAILDKVDDTLVLRYFELFSSYHRTNNEYNFDRSVVEFGRDIPNEYNSTFVNDRVSKCQCYIHITHYDNPGKWRSYTRYYNLISKYIVYPYNLKTVLKDTDYKYSMVWELVKNYDYINLEYLLSDAIRYPSFELLVKMKLYNLAFDCREFKNKGSFENRFGVPKEYYPFMKKYNITYKQLEILRLLKEPNIKKIRYLSNFSVYDLEVIANYISLNRFIKYAKSKRKKVETYIYKDYLKFASFLGFDLKSNKYAFPKNLREEHDKLEMKYEINNKKLINKAIVKREKSLKKYMYQDDQYIVMPAPTLNSLYDESKQQHHCVRDYAEEYAEGYCDIYFMRELKNKKKSLVTIEVRKNKIVQNRIKLNDPPSNNQLKFLQNWEQNVLKEVA